MAYSFSEIESALAELHHVADVKRSAFVGRLKHLQKRGFPPGVNTGRGHAATYLPQHAFLLAIELQVNELGLTPEKAIKIINRSLGYLCEGVLMSLAPTPVHLHSEIICFVPTRNLEDLTDGTISDFGLVCQPFSEWLEQSKENVDPHKNLGTTWRTSIFSFSSLIFVLPEMIRRDDPQHAIEFWEALRAWAAPIAELHQAQQKESGYLFRFLDGDYTQALVDLA